MVKEVITNLEQLSDRSEEIFDIRKNSKEVQEITIALKDTIDENGFKALSAPQIGYNKRMFVIKFDNHNLKTFVNPVINYQDVKGLNLSIEESPSIPGKKYMIIRNNEVPVMYQTPLGKIMSTKFKGMAAYILQQMMNSLDGVQLSDMGLEVDDDFINASEEEKAPIIEQYLKSLDIKQKSIENEIEESKSLSQIKEAGDFISSVNAGETTVNVTQEVVPEIKEEGDKK